MKIQKQRIPTDKCMERATELFYKLLRLSPSSRVRRIETIALALDAEYWKGAADTRREAISQVVSAVKRGYEPGADPTD